MNNKIKELRKEKKLSQAELSRLLNIDQTTVSRWEIGKNIPEPNMLLKLSELFDVSVDYLLGNSTYFYPDSVKSPAPALSSEERELLALFGEMTAAQKVRFVAYGEGMLGKVAEMGNGRKSS